MTWLTMPTLLKTLLLAVLPISLYVIGLFSLKRVGGHPVVRPVKGMLHLVLALSSVRLGLFLTNVHTEHGVVRLVTGALLFFSMWVTIRVLEFLSLDYGKRRIPAASRMPMFFRDIMRFLLLTMVVIVLLKTVFDVDPSALVVTSTVMSAIIGLALQDMLSNIVAGIALQIERPFSEDHWLRVGDREGKVLRMSWRSTCLRTRDGDVLAIPNASLASAEILNYNQDDAAHMVRQMIGTSYSDPPGKVKQVLLDLMADVDEVLKEPAPSVFVLNYGDFSIDYEMRFWVNDYGIEPRIRDQVMTRIWYCFARHGIHIPFPVRDVQLVQAEERQSEQARLAASRLDETLRRLREIDFLAALGEDSLAELAQDARFRQFGPGEFLVHQGDKEAALYVIVAGRVQVSVNRGTQQASTVGAFGPGYFFGEMALLTGEPRTASVVATHHVDAVVIDKAAMEPLLRENPSLAVTLSDLLKERSQELENLVPDPRESPRPKKQTVTFLTRMQRFFDI